MTMTVLTKRQGEENGATLSQSVSQSVNDGRAHTEAVGR